MLESSSTVSLLGSQAEPKIGILVLNRNGEEWLAPLYESIRSNRYGVVQIYLVDNASSDNSVSLTLARYPEVKVIQMPENLGYCEAYNLAMPHAFSDGCEWVVWANNDVLLESGCLQELASAASTDCRIGVVGPAFLAWEKDEPNYYIVGNYPHAIVAMKEGSAEPIDVPWVEGSFLMASRKCIEAVGPLDPLLFFYWEETDFCRRARFLGWRVALAPRALARHYAGGWSAAQKQNRDAANRLRCRNSYIYILADPFHSFAQNVLHTIHAFLVTLKANLARPPRLWLEVRSLCDVLLRSPTIHGKWKRDKQGVHPPTVLDNRAWRVQVVQGAQRLTADK